MTAIIMLAMWLRLAALALSQGIHQQLLNAALGDGTFTPPTNVFVALSSTAPTSTGGNVTEPSTGSYARVSTAAADWNPASAADPSIKDNANAITFPTATGDWLAGADLTHFALYDAGTGGTFVGSGLIGTPKAVANGDTPEFPAGALVAKLGASTDTF